MVVADERIDERRLPDSGRAEQHARGTRRRASDGFEPEPGPCRHDVDRDLAADLAIRRYRVRILFEVGFREQTTGRAPLSTASVR